MAGIFFKWRSLSNWPLRTFGSPWLATRGQGGILKTLKGKRVASFTAKYFSVFHFFKQVGGLGGLGGGSIYTLTMVLMGLVAVMAGSCH